MCPNDYPGKLELFLDYANNFSETKEVPDPYYGGLSGFDNVIDLVEDASKTLLSTMKSSLQAGQSKQTQS